jgi:hypothetical protein
VIHAASGYTAWSDKQAVYAAVSGPTGTSTPSNVDDYYSPEVNSNQIPLPGIVTAGTNFDCSKIQVSGDAMTPGNDWTTDFQAIQCYDQLKVNAVLNWIHGKTHLGASTAPAPVMFGMNFQAGSVGQKLIENGDKGGYTDNAATPTPKLASEISFVDAAIGEMVAALDGTTIIITAEHGQSPIDPNRFFLFPGHFGTNGTSPANLLAARRAWSRQWNLRVPGRPRTIFPNCGSHLGTPLRRTPWPWLPCWKTTPKPRHRRDLLPLFARNYV